jgi:hypothetical protein
VILNRMTEIPELLPPDEMPAIVDQCSLEDVWRRLMGKLGFGDPQLWILLLNEVGGIEVIVPVHDAPLAWDAETGAGLRHVLEHVGVHSFAFLFARPGGRLRTPDDLAWARALAGICRDLGSPWPVHLANDFELTVVAPDDLAQAC